MTLSLSISAGLGVLNPASGSYRGGGGGAVADPVGAVAVQTQLGISATAYVNPIAQINAAVTAYNAWANNLLTSLFQNVAGGNVTYTASTAQFAGTPDATSATWTAAQQIANLALWNTWGALLVSAAAGMSTLNGLNYATTGTGTTNTATALAVTDTKLIESTATDGLGAIVTSTGTFTAATMQWSGTPATSATVTETVQAALLAICNTGGAKLILAQTAIVADYLALLANAVSAAAGGTGGSSAALVVSFDPTQVLTVSEARLLLQKVEKIYLGIIGAG